MRGGWGNAIDVAALVGTIFCVANSFGLGVLQIGAGLDEAGIMPASNLAGALVLFLIIVGPTQFLLREFVQSIGNYLQDFVGLSFNVSAFAGAEGEAWQAAWTSFYWGWWISRAPFVAVFIARISQGRRFASSSSAS